MIMKIFIFKKKLFKVNKKWIYAFKIAKMSKTHKKITAQTQIKTEKRFPH